MKTNPNDSSYPNMPVYDGIHRLSEHGLTKREYFAAMALQGLLSNSYNDGATQPLSTASHDQIAQMAVSSADALIAELNKPTEQEG